MTNPADRSEPAEDEEVTMRTEQHEAADDALLAELREALADSRHPRHEQLVADGQAAFSFLTVADEFAALVFDSLWEDKLETTSRAASAVRALAFESAGFSVEIEVTEQGLVGQVSPAGSTLVEVQSSDGRRTSVVSDEFGSFLLTTAGSGPVRLRLGQGERRTVTDWFSSTA